MRPASDVDPDSEPFLRTLETAGAIAGMVGVVTLVAGGALGIQTMTATSRSGTFGREQHPTLAVGTAVTLLAVALAMLAAMMCWVALSYARPRLGRIADIKHEQRHRAELEDYRARRNAEDRRS